MSVPASTAAHPDTVSQTAGKIEYCPAAQLLTVRQVAGEKTLCPGYRPRLEPRLSQG